MLDAWSIEFAKGIGKFFINPLFYWAILLVLLAGYRRIKKERKLFGSKVFDILTEWKNTWFLSFVFGLLVSVVLLGVGVVFSCETIILLIIVIVLLSLTLRFTMLSPSYTVGITYLLLLFLPSLWEKQNYVDQQLFQHVNFTGLAILLGFLLLSETVLMSQTKRNETYPSLVRGKRGSWIGQHQVKKLSLIPIFMLVPTGMLTPMAPYWPLLPLGDETYSIILFPFLIGYDYKVIADLPIIAAKRIGKKMLIVSILVVLLALSSLYVPFLSLIAVLIAILGYEMIKYKERINNQKKHPYFFQGDDGLKVLSIIPGTPAERLGILVGEKITKVNGMPVQTVDGFYKALQQSGSFFKIDVLDDNGEIRFIQSAFYEGDHHKLGLIFTTVPYR